MHATRGTSWRRELALDATLVALTVGIIFLGVCAFVGWVAL